MNYRYVAYHLGLLLLVLAAALGLTTALELVVFGWTDGERLAEVALGVSTLLTGLAGAALWYAGRNTAVESLHRRDALLLVAAGWLVGAGLAATPYYVWAQLGGPGHVVEQAPVLTPQELAVTPAVFVPPPPRHPFTSPAACYFEAMSGLTTTGATVLSASPNDIESLPRGLLLWRALTHWLGGLGIVVLFVAVLPLVGGGGKKLFYAEAPGPKSQGVRPRIAETARALWMIYLILTVAQTSAFRIAGMTWFDSICHTFATLATGGFSTQNASMGAYYANPWIDWITVLFMVLAGVNFGLYYQLINRRFSAVFRDPELRLYLAIIAVASLVIAASIFGRPEVLTTGETQTPGVANALRDGTFQAVAVQTTTGFATVDFNQWSFLPKAVLIALMFVGGCAGSTGGGCKVVRVLVAAKIVLAEFERVFRPNVVKPTRVGGSVIDPEVGRSVLIYFVVVALLFGVGAVGLKLLEPAGSLDFTSAATASLTTLMNVGPGLSQVGAVENYGFFSAGSQMLMALWMALGRLEIFALLVLLYPRFWSGR